MGLLKKAVVVKAVTPGPGKPGPSPVAKVAAVAVIAKPGKVGRRR